MGIDKDIKELKNFLLFVVCLRKINGKFEQGRQVALIWSVGHWNCRSDHK